MAKYLKPRLEIQRSWLEKQCKDTNTRVTRPAQHQHAMKSLASSGEMSPYLLPVGNSVEGLSSRNLFLRPGSIVLGAWWARKHRGLLPKVS